MTEIISEIEAEHNVNWIKNSNSKCDNKGISSTSTTFVENNNKINNNNNNNHNLMIKIWKLIIIKS